MIPKDFSRELIFKTVRSSGAGGQNVNKVETSVLVKWSVELSELFSEEDKQRIREKLQNRINSEGILQLQVSDKRTQLENRKIAINRILEIVNAALVVPKKRFKTKPSRASQERRIDQKKQNSERKSRRNFRF